MKERCLVMLKPGALNRRLVGEVISRLESKGLQMIAMKMIKLSKEKAELHYEEHKGKDFYNGLIGYITSDPVIAMVWEADYCTKLIRKLTGVTNIFDSDPGTIRGDYCIHTNLNLIHASDSAESGAREVALFFTPEEIFPWEDGLSRWI